MIQNTIDEQCINTIRFLSADAVQQARSGHPGAPMGAAAAVYTLWNRFLRHNPADPGWPNRDRFVLSAGHASALLYSLLHLSGYDLSLDDLKNFRQWGSITPGHPEYRHTPGVEATTGPLGQGFANGVGMALAERWLAATYNRPEHEIIDHYTYALVSDGDLEEGISSEAASLAGHLQLGKLIYLYDDNGISIEGSTELAFSEDVVKRFQAYNWQVIGPIDGNSVEAVAAAILQSEADDKHPSLIVCRTVIGYGSPNKGGTASCHGEPLGEEELKLAKEKLGWPYPDPFTVPEEVGSHMRLAGQRGKQWQQQWQQDMKAYRQAYPELAQQLENSLNGQLPEGWDAGLPDLFAKETKPMATRVSSGKVLNHLAAKIGFLMGGSADLAPSTKTCIDEADWFSAATPKGRNLHFGVRENAMGSIANGMALHGGVIPYTATFLVFYDYMRPAVRLAAMMGIRVIFIFTHDSIGVGEDGPTHQPIEQIIGLRSVPNLVTMRPADAVETAVCWQAALKRSDGPIALVLTRQNLPPLDRSQGAQPSEAGRGGYVLWQSGPNPELILLATGSEVSLTLEAGKQLAAKGKQVRVVSLPSWELFEAQDAGYRQQVLPAEVKGRLAVEAASPMGWERYVGREGKILGIGHFGASAPGPLVMEKMGFTVANIASEALELLKARQ